MQLVKLKTVSLKNHPMLNEAWLQQVIADDPSLLGLGDLVLRDKERVQPSGGRVDLVFQHRENKVRYEVEIQLGSTDETHIIRTIEYWDVERSRYPQYDHKAVLIAENVTSRFTNVLRLFNGHIPLTVLQLNAIETEQGIALHFTKVMEEMQRGLIEDDESSYVPSTLSDWEKRSSSKSVKVAHDLLSLCKTIDANLELKPNKHYIGLQRQGVAFNFAYFQPRKASLLLSIYLPESQFVQDQLDQSGLDLLEYGSWGVYRIRLDSVQVAQHQELLTSLLRQAYDLRK